MERAGRDAAIAGEGAQAAGRRAWVWDWRWLAPAAAALVIAAVWIVQRPSNSNRESQSQTYVAMSRPSEPLTKEAPVPSRTPARGAPSAAAPNSEMAQNRALDKAQNAISREMNQPSANEKLNQVAPLDARRDADSNLSREIGRRATERFRGSAPLGRKPNPRHSRTLCKRPPLLQRRMRRPPPWQGTPVGLSRRKRMRVRRL